MSDDLVEGVGKQHQATWGLHPQHGQTARAMAGLSRRPEMARTVFQA